MYLQRSLFLIFIVPLLLWGAPPLEKADQLIKDYNNLVKSNKGPEDIYLLCQGTYYTPIVSLELQSGKTKVKISVPYQKKMMHYILNVEDIETLGAW